jgi:cytochrome c-type biogenesis protein CcmH/NrfG
MAPPPAPAAAPPAAPSTAAERDAAIEGLLQLRRSDPRNADHAAVLARLYFEKRWWTDGIAAFAAAVRLEPARRDDGVLIDHTIAALGSDKAADKAEGLLRSLGPTARAHLREAAKSHANPHVRARAAEILRPAKKPFLNWFGKK